MQAPHQADGFHLEVVQEQLGQSHVSLTLDTHSHGATWFQREAAGALMTFPQCTVRNSTRMPIP